MACAANATAELRGTGWPCSLRTTEVVTPHIPLGGGVNWYNYSIYACAIIPMKSLFFSVGTPEVFPHCERHRNPGLDPYSLLEPDPKCVESLVARQGQHALLPSPQDYPALRMSCLMALLNERHAAHLGHRTGTQRRDVVGRPGLLERGNLLARAPFGLNPHDAPRPPLIRHRPRDRACPRAYGRSGGHCL